MSCCLYRCRRPSLTGHVASKNGSIVRTGIQPQRINPSVWIVNIPLGPCAPGEPYRVWAQILPGLRVIVPEAVVVEARFLIEPLALEADRAVGRGVVIGGAAGEGFGLAPQAQAVRVPSSLICSREVPRWSPTAFSSEKSREV